MKKMKKILAFVLAMAMVLGMSVTSFAGTSGNDGKVGTSDDRGKIIIQNVDATVQTIEVYQIIKADYDATGNFKGYKALNADYYEILKGSEPAADNTNFAIDLGEAFSITADQINALGASKTAASKISTAINNATDDEIVFTYQKTQDANPQTKQKELGTFTSTDSFEVGMYLIVLKGAEKTIYNDAVASIFYQATKGDGGSTTGNVIEDNPLNINDATIMAKASEDPNVDKVIIDENNNEVKGDSTDIGGEVNYKVTVDVIPYYGGQNPKFEVLDTLTGLTLKDDTLVVKVFDKNGTAVSDDVVKTLYTLPTDKNGASLRINFVKDKTDELFNGYTLNNYAGGHIEITYSATLNADAKINKDENNNKVELAYSRDSRTPSGQDEPTKESKTYTYTFDIDGAAEGYTTEVTRLTEGILNKIGEQTGQNVTIDEKEIKNVLSEAKFTLYTKNPDTFVPDPAIEGDKIENYIYTNTTGFNGVVESNARGQLPIKGLAEGTYYLKETEAPSGYSLNTHVFEIEIEAGYYKKGDTDIPQGVEIGQLKSWTITIDDTTTNTFTVRHDGGTVTVDKNTDGKIKPVEIPNTKLSSLPSTGGIGTTIFTIGGCAIMILAAGLFFATRRKSAK